MLSSLMLYSVLVIPLLLLSELVEVFINRIFVVKRSKLSHWIQRQGGSVAVTQALVNVPTPLIVTHL